MTRPASHQERLYDAWYGKTEDDDFGFADRKILDALDPQQRAAILSLGGGQANDLWYLAGAHAVTIADFAMSGLRNGAGRGLRAVRLDLNTAPHLPFGDARFDVVICKDILEHILNPLDVLREARRVLRPGGRLIVNVPNHFYLPMRLRILLGKGIVWRSFFADHGEVFDEWDYMHIRFFTYGGFQRLLARAGFQPEHFYWDFGALAHYANPDMWLEPQERKRAAGRELSRRGRFAMSIGRPIWRVFNVILPRPIRAAIVSLAPGLFSASFYVRARKTPTGQGRS